MDTLDIEALEAEFDALDERRAQLRAEGEEMVRLGYFGAADRCDRERFAISKRIEWIIYALQYDV